MLSLRIAPSIRVEAFGFILHLDKPDYSSIAENKKAPLSCKVHVIDSSLLKSDLVITMTFILLQRRLFLGKRLTEVVQRFVCMPVASSSVCTT